MGRKTLYGVLISLLLSAIALGATEYSDIINSPKSQWFQSPVYVGDPSKGTPNATASKQNPLVIFGDVTVNGDAGISGTMTFGTTSSTTETTSTLNVNGDAGVTKNVTIGNALTLGAPQVISTNNGDWNNLGDGGFASLQVQFAIDAGALISASTLVVTPADTVDSFSFPSASTTYTGPIGSSGAFTNKSTIQSVSYTAVTSGGSSNLVISGCSASGTSCATNNFYFTCTIPCNATGTTTCALDAGAGTLVNQVPAGGKYFPLVTGDCTTSGGLGTLNVHRTQP